MQLITEGIHQALRNLKAFFTEGKKVISTLLTTTSSRSLQLLLAFLLGVLMSLTPCIYPMIPVTVGLLGARAGQSIGRNFLLALSYTIGLATVFALLGFLSVFFSSQCGQLACNPWVIIILVLLLGYSGGSMLGWYNLYIPRFFTPHTNAPEGSFISAFFFGTASGLIASPCMSPGLALILSVVATLGNYLLGLFLLFIFGVGSSMPLLIIGTFSGSIHLLPHAGMWMNEVKKFFGFMLIMMCFYYLQILLPLPYVLWGAALFSGGYGISYVLRITTARSRRATFYTCFMALILLTSALYEAYVGAMAWHAQHTPAPLHSNWLTDYDKARAVAQGKGQLLLLDFTASWCSLCVLLDKQILSKPETAPLFEMVTAVKVDGSSSTQRYGQLVEQFKVLGLPTLVLIDPQTEAVLRTWNSTLLEQTIASFLEEIGAAVHKQHAPK